MKIQFFMAMIPPTKTYQEKKVAVVKGKPVFYEPPEVKAVREKLAAHLSHYAPAKMFEKPVRMVTKWCFPKASIRTVSIRQRNPIRITCRKCLKTL